MSEKSEAEVRRLQDQLLARITTAEDRAELAVAGCERLLAQRGELLYALRTLLSYANVLEMRLLDADGEHRAMQRARAAIKMAEEGK